MKDFDAESHADSARNFHIKIRLPSTTHSLEWEIRNVVHSAAAQCREEERTCHFFGAESTQIPHQTAETRISPKTVPLLSKYRT